jgi:hypothetical protein
VIYVVKSVTRGYHRYHPFLNRLWISLHESPIALLRQCHLPFEAASFAHQLLERLKYLMSFPIVLIADPIAAWVCTLGLPNSFLLNPISRCDNGTLIIALTSLEY